MSNGTKWKDRFIQEAYNYCYLGASDAKLAGFFGVAPKTIKVWKRENKEFRESIEKGKDAFIAEKGEKALNKLVTGFKYKELTREPAMIRVKGKLPEIIDGYEIRADESKEGKVLKGKVLIGMTVTKEVTKMVPPNIGAIIHSQTNRQPERWKNTKNLQVSGPGGRAIPVTVIDSFAIPMKCPNCGTEIQAEDDTGPAS